MHSYLSHVIATWVQGLSWTVALFLASWPTRRRLGLAAFLWLVGSLVSSGLQGYALLAGVALVTSFSSQSFPLTGILFPLVSFGLIWVEAALLRPSVRQETALRVGRILLLGVGLVLRLLPPAVSIPRGVSQSPLDEEWLAPVLLWFLIRLQLGNLRGAVVHGPPRSGLGETSR
jgi:hypothetical protein